MATKYYGIRDNWTDDDVANVIEVASEDGSVSSVKVNGVEYGGGGGDFSTAEVTFNMTSDSRGDGSDWDTDIKNDHNAFYDTDGLQTSFHIENVGTVTTTLILNPQGEGYMYYQNITSTNIEINGNASKYDSETILVTGDCTITFEI